MKTLTLFFRSLMLLGNCLVILFLIVAAYSDRVSPATSVTMAYLGLGFPVFCFLNLLFLIYWLLIKRWKYLLVSVVAFLICWGPLRRYFPMHLKTDKVPQENVIKVLTYNVMNFANKRHTPLSPNRIIKYIAESNADIVCIQEFMASNSQKELNEKVINEALAMYPYRSIIRLNKGKYRATGLAVYSKFPITKSREINYNSEYNGSSLHELEVKGKKLVLINNHLESFGLTQKDKSKYASVIKSMDTEVLEEIRGTFRQKMGPAFVTRAEQAHLVAEEIAKAKADYLVVCGDFNDTPISYAHKVIQGDLIDSFEESGFGMGVTYNQNLFLFRIDNILHSPSIKAYNCTIDQVKYSDHYPMWCYLELK